ncbi:MAG: FAD:protein FMN transferase [Gemmataceae bacterium]
MATTFEVAIPQGSHPEPVAAAEDALDLIDTLEDQMTVYREHSEVSRINETASHGAVPVEAVLFDLFERCSVWTRESEGAFDIATGSLTKAWGFYRREGRVPSPREQAEAMGRTGMRHVILHRGREGEAHAERFAFTGSAGDSLSRSIKFRVPGLELNLGAVGKGYALDRAAELLRTKWGVRSALLHGGSSSVYAIGRPPGNNRGWRIRIRHPVDPEGDLGSVWLADRALGTSAATFQYFEYNGRKLGHVIDPRTGWPAEVAASASVTAPTAAEADAMSTAAFILGSPATESLTRTRPWLGAVMLDDRLHRFNLDPSD